MLEPYYLALFNNPVYGICRADSLGRPKEVNQTLLNMLGYGSADELIGSGLTIDVVGDRTERERLFEAQPVDSEYLYTELNWLRKDGSPIKVRLSGRQVVDGKGDIQGYQVIVEDIDQQYAVEEQLRLVAHTDALTGLSNYRSLQDALEAEIRRSGRTGREFSVLLLDLDDMKQINDEYGHLQGNRALVRVSAIIRQCCRSIDTLARFGGDEFVLVLPETASPDAWQLAMRIFNALNAEPDEPKLSVSLGCATYPTDGQSTESLLQAADKALYEMKNGRQLHLFVAEQLDSGKSVSLDEA
jgi:diguanylate cyclase (GGDEF)-like protein/PAS domain S-box-containing protein